MKRAAKWVSIVVAVLLVAGIIAPYLSGNSFAPRIRNALETALGRKVDIGAVHFSLFSGPGFSVDHVVIHENPAMGIEPLAYVGSLEAVPRLTSLFGGRLEFASIRLDDASINVAKTGGPAAPGHWNFEPLLTRSVIRAIPEVHVRSGRFNFKFGDTKSVFYLTGADLDISPPRRGSSAWDLEFSGEPARTDKPARGLGDFLARGRWLPESGGRLDLDVRLERSAISEIVELLHGSDAGIHGNVSARLRLAGPLDDIRIAGRMDLDDVHRWDQMPPYGPGWPLRLAGRLNALGQTIEVESNTAGTPALLLDVRFRCADFLSQPRWGVVLNWNRFPAAPVLDLARHMGAAVPANLSMSGTLDGVLGYAGHGSLQGQLDFHDAVAATPNAPPIRAKQAHLVFTSGRAHLDPAVVTTEPAQTAQLEADYDWRAQSLDLTISADGMHFAALRAQSSLAAIPWLEQVSSGTWKGQLRYRYTPPVPGLGPSKSGWSGAIDLRDAQFPVPGVADPVDLQSATAHIDGARVTLDHIHARAGKIAFQGQYQYVPLAARPHRLRISIPEADAAELERLLMPSLQHSRGLFARALSLGRSSMPGWLADRHVDATVQIGTLTLDGAEAHGVQANLLWDAGKAEFDHVQTSFDGGLITGTLLVNLRGGRPAYRFEASAQGMQWKSGTIDADFALESAGTGTDLLSHLHSTGTFEARGLEMENLRDLDSVSGAYDLVLTPAGPRWRFPELQLVLGEDTYTGQGTTGPDGRLLIQLSSGKKEMHMSGTLAELRLETEEPKAVPR